MYIECVSVTRNYQSTKSSQSQPFSPMLHENSVEGPFHVSKTFRNQNLSETRGNALEARFLKISVWKLSGNLRFYFGYSRFCSRNARTFQLVITCCYDFYFS